MDTTKTLLDAVKAALSLRSDYALAKFLGVTQPTVYRWREGGTLNDENAIRIADLLKISRAYVLACMAAERAPQDTESSGVWRQIAGAFRDKVALWLCALALCFTGFLSESAHAAGAFELRENVYYGKRRRRALKASPGIP
jgi:hypothetical protein